MSSLLRLDPKFQPAFNGSEIAIELVSKLVLQVPVESAFLFGSAAEGKNTSNSDLDVLVVVPDGSNIKDYYSVVNAPFYSPLAVDWIFKTKSYFDYEKNVGGISRIADMSGKKIYSKQIE